eukprot:GSChrysophyteH1.ASY1.ANO1.744.1 assembled CDS
MQEELPPFPTVGVKLSVFLKFIEDNGGRDAFVKKPFVKEPLTTTDVCNKFLKPITSEKEQSYCEYLQEQKSPDVGEASVFISHAWKYTFVEVVDALEHHFSNEPDIFIWFDLFSNNQHKAISFPFEWWRDTFLNAIGKLGRVVMVLSPWNNPIPFTRAWCLWEIYCAVTTGSKFEVAITPNQYTAFVKGITRRPEKFYQMLADINVEKSEAWSATDKERIFNAVKSSVGFAELNKMERIFNAVKSSVGFAELNKMVIGKMREWVITAIDESIEESKMAIWDGIQEKVMLMRDIGELSEALSACKKCIDDYKDIDEGRQRNVGDLMGSLLYSQNEYSKALKYYEKGLAFKLQKESVVDADFKWGSTYNNLGIVHYDKGVQDKAIEYYEKSLAIWLKTLGLQMG